MLSLVAQERLQQRVNRVKDRDTAEGYDVSYANTVMEGRLFLYMVASVKDVKDVENSGQPDGARLGAHGGIYLVVGKTLEGLIAMWVTGSRQVSTE